MACVLPTGPPLHLETWHLDEAVAQLTLRLTSTQALVHFPVCQFPTQRIHSHYTRTVADLPWAHLHVVLQLGVRKFFCANGRCTRSIFTERLPQLLAPWARRTQRLAHRLGSIAVALGGAAGALLSQQLGMPVSRNTLLRLLRRLPVPSRATPTVLGVDDSPCGNATPMGRSWWTRSATTPWRSCQSAPPTPWRNGSGSIRGSK